MLRMENLDRYGLALNKSLRLEPVIKLIDPVIAVCAFFRHAKAMASALVDMRFGIIAGIKQSLLKSSRCRSHNCIVLRPCKENRRQASRNRGRAERSAVNWRREVRPLRSARLLCSTVPFGNSVGFSPGLFTSSAINYLGAILGSKAKISGILARDLSALHYRPDTGM